MGRDGEVGREEINARVKGRLSARLQLPLPTARSLVAKGGDAGGFNGQDKDSVPPTRTSWGHFHEGLES